MLNGSFVILVRISVFSCRINGYGRKSYYQLFLSLSLSLSRYLGWLDLFGLSNWEESSNSVMYLSFNSLSDNYSCINGRLMNLYFFLAASRVGENCQTYKCREDRFFWINFNENTQGRVISFSSFPNLNDFLHSLWLILAIIITIGYRSNREADKRWSKIDGTWCWTNQVANSSGGTSLFLGFLLYVLTLKFFAKESLLIFSSFFLNWIFCFSVITVVAFLGWMMIILAWSGESASSCLFLDYDAIWFTLTVSVQVVSSYSQWFWKLICQIIILIILFVKTWKG